MISTDTPTATPPAPSRRPAARRLPAAAVTALALVLTACRPHHGAPPATTPALAPAPPAATATDPPALAPTSPPPGATATAPPALAPASPSPIVDLGALLIAPEGPMAGYADSKFPHWAAAGPPSCNTREIVLQRQGTDVVQDADCRAVSGRWVSPYDGQPITDPRTADVDHLVSLAEAWRSGAASWTREDRKRFANDLAGDELILTTATINRSKGDRGPAEWKPPLRSHWCLYASRWVAVKIRWHLTADPAERDHLAAMLATCPT